MGNGDVADKLRCKGNSCDGLFENIIVGKSCHHTLSSLEFECRRLVYVNSPLICSSPLYVLKLFSLTMLCHVDMHGLLVWLEAGQTGPLVATLDIN